MNLFRAEVLRSILEMPDEPSVSIFMPVNRSVPEDRQNPVRLKNLIRDAQAKLVASGQDVIDAQLFMGPAISLIDNQEFWRHRADGLAVYVRENDFRHYHLPFPVEELVVVGSRWHLKPLMPALSVVDRFYILALSQNDVRLWEATKFGTLQLELKGLTESMKESLSDDEFERELQYHTGGPARQGRRDAQFFGTGSTSLDDKALLKEHLLDVDREVRATLAGEKAPLVIAAVDHVASMYQQVSQYPNVVENPITGNADRESIERLHTQAVGLVEPLFEQKRIAAEDEFARLLSKNDGRASKDTAQVVKAAYDGRVDTLFVSLNKQVWGEVDQNLHEVIMHDEALPQSSDLLDLAAMKTLANGGGVYALEADKMPSGADITAIMRY